MAGDRGRSRLGHSELCTANLANLAAKGLLVARTRRTRRTRCAPLEIAPRYRRRRRAGHRRLSSRLASGCCLARRLTRRLHRRRRLTHLDGFGRRHARCRACHLSRRARHLAARH